MATICPKDGKGCIDDLCRGSGVCGITGHEMWDECPRCHGVYSTEFGVDCACEPTDDYDEDGPEDWDSFFTQIAVGEAGARLRALVATWRKQADHERKFRAPLGGTAIGRGIAGVFDNCADELDALLSAPVVSPPQGRSCCEAAPDRSGRNCDKPKGHDGDHWTYGGKTLTWPAAAPVVSPVSQSPNSAAGNQWGASPVNPQQARARAIGGGKPATHEDDSQRSWPCGCYEDQGGYHLCWTHAAEVSAVVTQEGEHS